jgi:hypothetical protein
MLAQLSMWVLTATLAQAAPEPAWLKAVPADVDVAIQVRGLESARDDVVAMLKAMSPAFANTAEPALKTQLDQFAKNYGTPSTRTPFVTLIRVVDPAQEGSKPFAVLVLADNYEGVLKSISGGKDVKLTPQDGGFDAFDSPEGNGTWYAAKGTGFVAFGADKKLVAAVARPGEQSLDSRLTPALRKAFLDGDAGVYVNAATLVTRYADQIDQARQALMNALDNAGQQMGNAGSMEAAKQIYGGLFDALKVADMLALDLDAAAEGANLSGVLAVKPDSDAARAIAQADPGTGAELAKLAADSAFYVYMKLDAEVVNRLQAMGMKVMAPEGKTTPEQQKALDQLRAVGRIESVGAMTMDHGMRGLTVVETRDPQAQIAATGAMLQSMKGGEGSMALYKDVKTEANVQTEQGFTISHTRVTMDMDKMAKLQGNNPAAAASMKGMFGGDTLDYWTGTDGKRVVQIMTPNWEDAKTLLDNFVKGENAVGNTAGFKAVREKLPEKSTMMVIVSMQGLVKMFASQFSAMTNKPDLKAPGDMPKEPALLGVSLTPVAPTGYEFHLVVPSTVGPVIEKGLVPLFQGLQGQVTR